MFSKSLLALAIGTLAAASPLTRRAGAKTLLIGQGNTDSWNDFSTATGAAPQGGSVYYGVKAGTWDGASGSASHLAYAQFLVGKNAEIEVGISWKDDPPNWDGNDADKTNASQQATADIAAGKYDSQFDTLIQFMSANTGSTFLLRIDYEVSSAFHCAGGTDCSVYKDAFAHLRQLISGKASNAKFVYHPVRGEFDKLYPGDDVVDVMGVSVFNQDICMPFFNDGQVYYNGDENTQNNTCEGYYNDQVDGGNVNAFPFDYPADLNILRYMWWAQQKTKPFMICESGVQRYDGTVDSNGLQSQDDFTSWMTRFATLFNYKGPLPNGQIEGTNTNFVGQAYDLTNVVQYVTFINIDWRYGFDGKVDASTPLGTDQQSGWYVNGLISQYAAGKQAMCGWLTQFGFSTTC